MINYIAIRSDCTAITGQSESHKEAAEFIIRQVDGWCQDIVKVYIENTDAAYSMDEIREIASS